MFKSARIAGPCTKPHLTNVSHPSGEHMNRDGISIVELEFTGLIAQAVNLCTNVRKVTKHKTSYGIGNAVDVCNGCGVYEAVRYLIIVRTQ